MGTGICMDINWKDFEEGKHDQKPLALTQVLYKTELLIFSSAWTIREEEIKPETRSETINYWAWRLDPIIKSQLGKFHFLCANRVGKEKQTNFVGTSCVLELRPSPCLHAALDCTQRKCLRHKIDI